MDGIARLRAEAAHHVVFADIEPGGQIVDGDLLGRVLRQVLHDGGDLFVGREARDGLRLRVHAAPEQDQQLHQNGLGERALAEAGLLRLLEIGERLPQRLPVVLRAQDEAEARLGQREAAVERAVRPARAGQKLRRQIQDHALIRRAGRGLRPVDAALRDEDHVAGLKRVAPPLEPVARRTAEEEDQLVEGMVMPVQLLLHRSFQVEQAEILAQIPALHIFRLRHGLPPSQGYLCLKGVSET